MERTCKRHDRRVTIDSPYTSGRRRERRNAVSERYLKMKIPEVAVRDFFIFQRKLRKG